MRTIKRKKKRLDNDLYERLEGVDESNPKFYTTTDLIKVLVILGLAIIWLVLIIKILFPNL